MTLLRSVSLLRALSLLIIGTILRINALVRTVLIKPLTLILGIRTLPLLLLCAVLGAVSGPLSYYAGQRLGAVAFPLGLWPTLIGLGLLWGGLFPTLQWLAGKFSHPAR